MVACQPSTQNGGPGRRTSARLKKIEANAFSVEKRSPQAKVTTVARRVVKRPKLESPIPKEKPQVMAESADNTVSNTISADKNDYTVVMETIRAFNKQYLHFVQVEEKRCAKEKADREKLLAKNSKSKKKVELVEISKNPSARPDLKAASEMMRLDSILNSDKRIGSIPGIDVGHQFFSRAEMVVVGFHQHWLNGIDYIGESCKKLKTLEGKNYKLPITTSIVLSGQYEDDFDNYDEIVYTGQGGNDLLGNKRQIKDQVMQRGNLGLKNSMDQSVPIRVVRGHVCRNSYVKKVYTYDGLYKVVDCWTSKGASGFVVYRFRLKRLEGQPPLTTDQVHFTRGRSPKSVSELQGLVCPDITNRQENKPIPATNLVDDPPIPPEAYAYIKELKFSPNINVRIDAPSGCNCGEACTDPRTCACAKLNGDDFPYVEKDGGRLVGAKSVVFECGPSCGCGPKCVNRASQGGPKYRLEVFRTRYKGWGVRSWDYIPSGAPVCEYIGLLKKTDDLDLAADNTYVFDIDCLQTMRGLDGRERRLMDVSLPSHLQKVIDDVSESVPFCIDAGETGNVARYINHSCQPNLFVQCVLSHHHDIRLARIVLFAADNIPPLKELTYDYGYALDSVVGPDGEPRQMACHCGAIGCRKRLY